MADRWIIDGNAAMLAARQERGIRQDRWEPHLTNFSSSPVAGSVVLTCIIDRWKSK